jgi:hypothetical protein
MSVIPNDAQALGEDDASDGTQDSALLTVLEIAEWVPESYRQAYLDGVARVLGTGPLVES